MFDSSNDSAHISSIDLDEQGVGKRYKMVFKTENLKLIPGAYEVKISSKGIASFKNEKANLQYWIATEAAASKYEG
jgi:phage-related protein